MLIERSWWGERLPIRYGRLTNKAQNQQEQRRELAGMGALLQNWFGWADWPLHRVKPEIEPQDMVGDYIADYTELTQAQIEEAKAACAEHIARSKLISVKRGL